MTYAIRYFQGKNVVGYLGPLPDGKTNSIVVMAHHDHLGIRPSPNSNDSIYNGAVDNASGLSALLTASYAMGNLYRPPFVVTPNLLPASLRKSVIFVSSTAEEAGLLGALYFVQNAPCPSSICHANSMFNFDTLNVWGKTEDVVTIGQGLSKGLDETMRSAAAGEKMTITPDPSSELGHLFRGDQFPFILHDVPAVSIGTGTNFGPSKPADYYKNVTGDFVAHRYHQPSDEYSESLDMAGVEQQVRVALRAIFYLATSKTLNVVDSNNGMLPKY